MTLRVPTFATDATRFVEREFKFEIEMTLRVPTFATDATRFVERELKFEIEITLRVPTLAVGTTRDAIFASVVTLIYGIVIVSKKNVVFTELAIKDPGTTRLAVLDVPDTLRFVKIPTDVMFGCDACDTTSATFAFATFPVTLDPEMFASPEAFPVYKFEFKIPETVRDVRTPTLVIFG